MSNGPTIAELVQSAPDLVGDIRETLRTELHSYLDGLSTIQNRGIPRKGSAHDDPIQCRFDHRVLDDLVTKLAPAIAKKVFEQRVQLAPEAEPVTAVVPLADVLDADPILRELLDATGSARAALQSMAIGIEHDIPPNRIPLSLVVWSRMVDAHRRREGKPALDRISCDANPVTYMTPAQFEIDRAAQRETISDRAQLEAEMDAIEMGRSVEHAKQTTRERDKRAIDLTLPTRAVLRERVHTLLRAWLEKPNGQVNNDDVDEMIAAVTDVPCHGERCPRCHKGAPNAQGCALCNPTELGRRLKASDV